MRGKVEYTHCKSCDGTGLSPSNQFVCCLSCIGQGGLYIEPNKVVTEANKPIDKTLPLLDNRA